MVSLAKASLISGAMLLAVEANASVAPMDANSPGQVVFILNGPENPTAVQVGVNKLSGQKFMRLPDLGTMSHKIRSENNSETSALSTVRRQPSEEHRPSKTKVSHAQKTTLKFNSAKVSGKPKLPSIKFSSLSPMLELYEEMPSLDFTDKSLKDGGF